MSIAYSVEAEADLRAVALFLVERNPKAAIALVQRIFRAIDVIAEGHLDGPEAALRSGEIVRSWAVPPLRIYYQRKPDALWIVRIYHQARKPIAR